MREMCKMKNINKKIFFLLLIFLVAFIGLKVNVVYASSEAEELKELLSENEENITTEFVFNDISILSIDFSLIKMSLLT